MSGRALVTGAGGFVGAHLVARLRVAGWDVVAFVRPGGDTSRLDRQQVVGVAVDLADVGAVGRAVRAAAPDVAFHLAAARAKATAAERAVTTAVNTTSGQHLVEALPATCRVVVRLGSSTEYAEAAGPMDENAPLRPRGLFGATKAAGTLLLTATAAERGLRSVVLRAFQVYGSRDHPGRFVPCVLRAARTGEPLPLTRAGLCRDWVHVDDVVEACVLAGAAEHLPGGQVLNLGTGVQTSNEQLVALAEQVTGRPLLVRPGAHPGRDWDAVSWVCDPSMAGRLLGWQAQIDLTRGLARCWADGA